MMKETDHWGVRETSRKLHALKSLYTALQNFLYIYAVIFLSSSSLSLYIDNRLGHSFFFLLFQGLQLIELAASTVLSSLDTWHWIFPVAKLPRCTFLCSYYSRHHLLVIGEWIEEREIETDQTWTRYCIHFYLTFLPKGEGGWKRRVTSQNKMSPPNRRNVQWKLRYID